MKLLEDEILNQGELYPGNVLKVGSFLNHQIDTQLLTRMGEEFYRLYKDEHITKVLTIESSGIAIAFPVAYLFGVPLVFAKKSLTSNISGDNYTSEVRSYTHGNSNIVRVEKKYINSDDRILIIDDFLANGCALEGLIEICRQAGATVVGAGIAIEKAFQGGGQKIRENGIRVESLARIKSMDYETGIVFDDSKAF